jgi:predicted 3-demethylubiquinone-9 3-methyltransferase (glyoxalase superfamily)
MYKEAVMARTLTPFLMFQGDAEAAIQLYASLFSGSTVEVIDRYGPGERGAEGAARRAALTISGQRLICFDSPERHDFTFTPSMSLFVECEDEAELDAAFGALSAGGSVLMPPNNYGFSRKFAWLNDRFGVSWQLNLR